MHQVEYALNNTVSSTTHIAPSNLLFGVSQRGVIIDELSEYLEDRQTNKQCDFVDIRNKADEAIQQSQERIKERNLQKNQPAIQYKLGDYVVIRFFDTIAGGNKKLNPKYRGPYVVKKVLPNDRYHVTDIENCQITQMPYRGVIESCRMKHWVKQLNSHCLNNNIVPTENSSYQRSRPI